MSSLLLALLSELPDPLRDLGKMYPLAPILLFTVLGMSAGPRSYRQVHAFIQTHLDRLNSALGLSLRFIIYGLDAAGIERAFRAYAAGLADAATEGTSVSAAGAVNGKPCAAALTLSITARRRIC